MNRSSPLPPRDRPPFDQADSATDAGSAALRHSFTPGPWRADDEIVGWWGGECPAVAVMFKTGPSTWAPVAHCKPSSKTEFETISNAHLIAAAPELYEAAEAAANALELILNNWSLDEAETNFAASAYDRLIHASAKARGQA